MLELGEDALVGGGREMILRCRDRVICFPRRPLIMGIVNINDDSFSGDGSLELEAALALAAEHVRHGADIIDVGGESARTNREAISEDEEIRRVAPFLEAMREEMRLGRLRPRDGSQVFPPLLSVNTWRPKPAAELLLAGAEILNDMGALPTAENARAAARHGAALLIMHSVGEPKTAHTHICHDDILASLETFFSEKTALALEAGVTWEHIILDPGIDFAKQRDDNLRLLGHLERLAALGRPILLPVSRKTLIGEVLGLEDAVQRDAGTQALIVEGMERGACIFRVHNVEAAWQTITVIDALRRMRLGAAG